MVLLFILFLLFYLGLLYGSPGPAHGVVISSHFVRMILGLLIPANSELDLRLNLFFLFLFFCAMCIRANGAG